MCIISLNTHFQYCSIHNRIISLSSLQQTVYASVFLFFQTSLFKMLNSEKTQWPAEWSEILAGRFNSTVFQSVYSFIAVRKASVLYRNHNDNTVIGSLYAWRYLAATLKLYWWSCLFCHNSTCSSLSGNTNTAQSAPTHEEHIVLFRRDDVSPLTPSDTFQFEKLHKTRLPENRLFLKCCAHQAHTLLFCFTGSQVICLFTEQCGFVKWFRHSRCSFPKTYIFCSL